jgi:hypothetical protein
MKKLMAALLLLVAMSSVAAAQDPFIGLYSDDVAVSCQGTAPQYQTSTVYVIATLPETIPGMTACEFRIDNLPTAALAITTFTWNTTLVIGTPGYNLALAFAPALPGPNCLLGTIGFFALADFGADFRMTVAPGLDLDKLVIVDLNYEEIPCEQGHFFTFNCTGTLPGGCDCTVGVATEDATWGQIKALY